MAISLNDLKKHMQFHIAALTPVNDNWLMIPENVPHKDLLPSGGQGHATADRIYKSAVRFSIHQGGSPVKNWPSKWQEMSISELAPKLL